MKLCKFVNKMKLIVKDSVERKIKKENNEGNQIKIYII